MIFSLFLSASAREGREGTRTETRCRPRRRRRGADAKVWGKARHYALHPCHALHGGRRGNHQIRQLLHGEKRPAPVRNAAHNIESSVFCFDFYQYVLYVFVFCLFLLKVLHAFRRGPEHRGR